MPKFDPPSRSDSQGSSSSLREKIPNFAMRILKLSLVRLRASMPIKIYASCIVFSTVFGIVLESIIASAHEGAAQDLSAAVNDADAINSPFSPNNAGSQYVHILLSLRRLKDENVFFILFHIFQFYLGMDALVRQSVIQLIAHVVNELVCVILAAVQLGETMKWKGSLSAEDGESGGTSDFGEFDTALKFEIGLAAVMGFLTITFAVLCWKISREFGYNIYKRLGADPNLQKRFRVCQVFLLTLKLDGFFHIVFSIFWLVVMTQEGYHKRNGATITWYVIHLILTVLQFPTPFLGRQGLRTEESHYMALFLTMHGLLVINFIIVIQQSANSWVFWVLAVCLAIVLCIVTICLGALVTRNFNKGLKPHVQRLFDENFRYNLNPTANATIYDKPRRDSRQNQWAIDDDDDDDDESSFAHQQQPLTPPQRHVA